MFDRDQSGTINFNEFCGLWNYITQWKGAFDRYDTDRSGSIEANELHRVFTEMGYRVSPNFVQLIVVKYVFLSIFPCFMQLSFRIPYVKIDKARWPGGRNFLCV